jgi:hypothetical protein
MALAWKVAAVSLVAGGLMGLLVLGAAAVAGRRRKGCLWLAGTAWGALTCGLLLTDCLGPQWYPAPSAVAVPLLFGGVFGWPIALVWQRPQWFVRWVGAQLVMLLTAGPAYLILLVAALCALS